MKPQVPQQPNGYDCGYYALNFALAFMERPEQCREFIKVKFAG
jgi:Protease, Ulp1 family